eukprot:364033-Chlamydomonas_euryale.AAC.7
MAQSSESRLLNVGKVKGCRRLTLLKAAYMLNTCGIQVRQAHAAKATPRQHRRTSLPLDPLQRPNSTIQHADNFNS